MNQGLQICRYEASDWTENSNYLDRRGHRVAPLDAERQGVSRAWLVLRHALPHSTLPPPPTHSPPNTS